MAVVTRLQTCGEFAEYLENVCEARCFGSPWESGASDWNVQRVLDTLAGSESADDNDLANLLIRCCSFHDLNGSMFITAVIKWLRQKDDQHITRAEPLIDNDPNSEPMTTLPPGIEIAAAPEWSDVPESFSPDEGATLADWRNLIDTCLGRSGSSKTMLRIIVGSGELCFQVKNASRPESKGKATDTP